MITIVGSARGSASLPNKISVPSTKIATTIKHTSCASSSAATTNSNHRTIHHPTDNSTKNTAASKAHGKCNQTPITINGTFSNRQRPSSANSNIIIDRTNNHQQPSTRPSEHTSSIQLAVYHRHKTYPVMHSVLRTMHQQVRR